MSFVATWMDLETIILSEVIQRQILYGITYMQKLKYDTNELLNRNRLRHREQICVCNREGGGEGRIGSLELADTNYHVQDG